MVVRRRLSAIVGALLLVAALLPAATTAAPIGGAPYRVPPSRPSGAVGRVLHGGLAALAERSARVATGILRAGSSVDAGARGPEVAVSITLAPDDRSRAEALLVSLGGRVANRDPRGVEAYVPERSLAMLAGAPGVVRIDPIVRPVLSATLADAVTLQGADRWQAAGTAGAGVRVGIIDGGFAGMAALLGIDLPPTVHARCYTAIGAYTTDLTACDQGGQVHGTAVAESLAAMAPAASLWIADPSSPDDLRSTVDWMTSNGVRIINASWTDSGFEGPWDGTSPYPDSAYALVDRAVAGGALWVNAAGNSGEQGWIGPWREDANGWLEFSGTDTSNRLTLQQGDHVTVSLRWSDPWGHASDDYDLGLYQAGDPFPVASSSEIQNGAGDPVETLEYDVPWTGQYEISAHRRSGGAAARVQLLVQSESEAPLQYSVPDDTLAAPADGRSPGLLVVGAVDVAAPGTVEAYSSRGPTLDGRIKPDLVAADCANTRSIAPFCGTSQAAPFVAGAAADVLSANPTWTTAQLVQFLSQHATALGSPVPNPTAGYGRLTLGPAPNVPTALRFVDQPIGGAAGAPWPVQPVVAVLDARGQRVATGAGATLAVTLSASAGAGPTGAALTCAGGTTTLAVAGLARFIGCSIGGAAGGVVLTASASGLTPATTGAFDVVAAGTPAPTLTLTPSARTITWASGVTLAVQLDVPAGGPAADGRQVDLQASADALSWETIATLTTAGDGRAAAIYRPVTNLWYRAILRPTADLAAAASPPVRVVVRQIALLRPTNSGATAVVARGTTVTFSTTVRPSRPELPVPVVTYQVYRAVAGGWALAAQVRAATSASGVATLIWRFSTSGTWYVRAAAIPTPLNANSVWSPPVRYAVR